MRYVLSMILLLLSVSTLYGDTETSSGLKYRDAVVKIGDGCSAVCVSPDGIFLTANHCGYRVNQTYETNVSGLSLQCVYNTGRFDGVTVMKVVGASPPRTYIPISEKEPQPGDDVYAMGYPTGKFSYHEAKIKRVGRNTADGNVYYTINQRLFEGHSGGPLLTTDDKVIGILSTRSLLPKELNRLEFTEPESNFLALPVINDSLRKSGATFNRPIQRQQKGKPKIVVFTIPGCGPCESFKRDYYSGRFPDTYDFVIVTWNGREWHQTPNDSVNYACEFQKKFNGTPRAFPTFWVYGTAKVRVQYSDPPSLLGFVRDSIKLIERIIIGEDRRDNGFLDLPTPIEEPPENLGLIEKYGEIKEKVDQLSLDLKKIDQVEDKISDSVEKYEGIAGKVDLTLKVIKELKDRDSKDDPSILSMISQLKEMKDRIETIREQKETTVSTSSEDDSGGLSLWTVLGIAKNFGPLGVAGGFGTWGLYRLFRRWRDKKKDVPVPTENKVAQDVQQPVVPPSQPSPPSPPSPPSVQEFECQIGERLLDRLNQLERSIQKPPITIENPPIKETDIKQRYVPYETERFKEAVAYAHEQLTKKYPGTVGTVEFIDSVVDQYLKETNAKEK